MAMQYNKEFGYSRKDILLIGGGLLGLGLGAYYGLQAFGMEPGMAGNFVQFGIFVFFCVGWISSYLFRVLNKVSYQGCKGALPALEQVNAALCQASPGP